MNHKYLCEFRQIMFFLLKWSNEIFSFFCKFWKHKERFVLWINAHRNREKHSHLNHVYIFGHIDVVDPVFCTEKDATVTYITA